MEADGDRHLRTDYAPPSGYGSGKAIVRVSRLSSSSSSSSCSSSSSTSSSSSSSSSSSGSSCSSSSSSSEPRRLIIVTQKIKDARKQKLDAKTTIYDPSLMMNTQVKRRRQPTKRIKKTVNSASSAQLAKKERVPKTLEELKQERRLYERRRRDEKREFVDQLRRDVPGCSSKSPAHITTEFAACYIIFAFMALTSRGETLFKINSEFMDM